MLCIGDTALLKGLSDVFESEKILKVGFHLLSFDSLSSFLRQGHCFYAVSFSRSFVHLSGEILLP